MEEKKELVRYHNDMNKYALGALKEKELDLFFSICYRLKKDRVNEVTLDFYELRNLAEFDNKNLSRFIASIKNVIKKFSSLLVEVGKDENNCTIFPLFDKYKISSDSTSVSFRMHEDYQYLLFADFSLGHFTEFELKQFISLKSGYSKNIFKFLKQNHYKGNFEIELNEFRRVLDVPKTYRMTHINDRVLKPALEELSQYFINLKLEKIKSGKTVSKLLFTWEKGIEVISEKQEEPKGKSKIVVEHGKQLDMFLDKEVIKKPVVALTPEEIRERNLRIVNEKKNNLHSEQKTEVKEDVTPLILEEIKKNSEQSNNNTVPGGTEKKLLSEYEEFLEWKRMKKKYFKEKQEIDRDEKEKSDIEFNITKEANRGGRFFTDKDIEEELLLDKNGNKLSGIALKMRVRKILKDMN